MEIRDARLAECDGLSQLALRSKAMWGYSAEFIEQCREELTVRPSMLGDGFVRVIADAETLLGFASLRPLSDVRAEIEFFFIAPEQTRRGLGARLFADIVALAKQHGFEQLEVVSDPFAVEFYAAQGCKPIGERASQSIPGRFLPLLEICI